MTTTFKLLLQSSGLSRSEAAQFLDVSEESVRSWYTGRRNCPDGVIEDMYTLIDRQEGEALQALDVIENSPDNLQEIEISAPATDKESLSIGWPCFNAQLASFRRLLEMADNDTRKRIRFVQRGST